jgi:NAD(P)-dependent dehydrogenase (short-subunit alcohol dehydrogenase family)
MTMSDSPRRVAVVTGGGSGIGRAMVDHALAEGLAVVVTDLNVEALVDVGAREDFAIVAGDITDAAVVAAAIDTAVRRFGRLDVLVNCAGRPDRYRGVDECTDEEWEYGLALHLTAPFQACRLALPHLRAAGGGLIVNVSSASGWTGGNGGAAYTCSKHALVGLSRNIAAMYVEDNIRCIVICPGMTQTGASAVMQRMRKNGELSERSEATRARTRGAHVRRADPDEIGALFAHLLRGGDALLNGGVLKADSGYSAYR